MGCNLLRSGSSKLKLALEARATNAFYGRLLQFGASKSLPRWPGRRKLPYMATPREYEVVLMHEDDGGFSVTVPALPGCVSQGETRDEALAMIREAIEVYIESLVAHGDPIPGPVEIERVTVAA